MIILFSALVALVVGLVIGWAFGREWEAIDCQPLHAAATAVVSNARADGDGHGNTVFTVDHAPLMALYREVHG